MICGKSEGIVDIKESKYGVKHADDDHYGANGAVEHEHTAESERMFHLGDEIGEGYPPQHGSCEDRQVAAHRAKGVFRHSEGELCEQRDEKKDDQGIGERKEERSDEILHGCSFLSRGLAHGLDGVGEQRVQTEGEKQGTAANLHPEDIISLLNEGHHHRHSGAGYDGVEQIRERCA